MPQWVSIRAFAREMGVRHRAVQKAVESGRVTAVKRDPTGRLVKIDAELARLQWAENTDPAQAARSGRMLPVVPELPLGPGAGSSSAAGAPNEEAAPTGAAAPDGKDPHGYYRARAEREQHQAKLAELEYLKAIGRLVPAEELREAAVRRYRAIRDKLLNIPDRQAAILAAETDPARVHAALTAEIKRVLHELSDDAGAEIARGAAERVEA